MVGGWVVGWMGGSVRFVRLFKTSSKSCWDIYQPIDKSKQANRTNQPITHSSNIEKTYPLLSKLPGALVLSVSQKFNDTALIGGKTGDLADDVTDEGSAAGRTAFGAADTGLGGVQRGGGLFPLASKFNQEFQHMNRIQVIANPVGRSR